MSLGNACECSAFQAPAGWRYANAEKERVEILDKPASIAALIAQIIAGSIVDRVMPRDGCNEREGKKCGAQRVWFALTPRNNATVDAIDQLLNGRFGLRAHYARDACAGDESTSEVCTAIADALVANRIPFVHTCSGVDRRDLQDRARLSLLMKSAKIWFDSDTDTRAVLREDAELTCDRWLDSRRTRRSELADLLATDRQYGRLAEQQIAAKLIKGATAPLPRFLDVKGAFICADGREYVPINKRRRADQIHLLGWT